MKKLINGVLFLALVGTTLFTSCSKTAEVVSPNTNTITEYKTLTDGENGNVFYKLVFENGQYSCPVKGGGNCICGDDDIVITPDNTVFMDVFSEIDKGDAHAISQIFEVNYDVLTRYVKPFYVKGVVEGRLSVTAHENQKNNLKFFFFKDVSSGEEMAYQLNFVK